MLISRRRYNWNKLVGSGLIRGGTENPDFMVFIFISIAVNLRRN